MNTMNEEMRMRTREEGMESKHRESYQESSEGYVRKLYQEESLTNKLEVE